MSSDEEAEFTGTLASSDEDIPLVNLKKPSSTSNNATPKRAKQVDYAEPSDQESSDDDIPLAALVTQKRTPEKQNGNAETKKKKTTNDKKPPKKKDSVVSNKSGTEKSYEWASMALYGTESVKGLLIQRLLCRWWYAITWPDQSVIPNKPPKNYDALDGFPGVYVCTQGGKVGQIKDLRDQSKAPSFKNFARKSAQELKELLLTALENQKKQLIEVEGTGTTIEREINDLIKWTTKVNAEKAEKAEKEAAKVLKASRLELR